MESNGCLNAAINSRDRYGLGPAAAALATAVAKQRGDTTPIAAVPPPPPVTRREPGNHEPVTNPPVDTVNELLAAQHRGDLDGGQLARFIDAVADPDTPIEVLIAAFEMLPGDAAHRVLVEHHDPSNTAVYAAAAATRRGPRLRAEFCLLADRPIDVFTAALAHTSRTAAGAHKPWRYMHLSLSAMHHDVTDDELLDAPSAAICGPNDSYEHGFAQRLSEIVAEQIGASAARWSLLSELSQDNTAPLRDTIASVNAATP